MTMKSFNKKIFPLKTGWFDFLLLKTFFLAIYFQSFCWAATKTAASAHSTSEWTEHFLRQGLSGVHLQLIEKSIFICQQTLYFFQ